MNDYTDYTFKNSFPEILDEDLIEGLSSIGDAEDIFDVLYGHLPWKQTRLNGGRLNSSYLKIYERHCSPGGIIFKGQPLTIDGVEVIAPYVQVKLVEPMFTISDKEKKIAKWIKYKTPTGSCNEGVGLPPFTQLVRDAIHSRWGISLTCWEDVLKTKLPIILTEGFKKAYEAMLQGFLAISLPGVWGGVRKTESGTKRLVQGLTYFCNNREFILAFDQDEKRKTRTKVEKALVATYFTLKAQQCSSSFLTWEAKLGKGLDDFIHNGGNLEELVANRLSVEQFRLQRYTDLSQLPTTTIHEQFVPSQIIKESTAQIVGLKANKGTGKTTALAFVVQEHLALGHKVLVLSHRRALARMLAHDFSNPKLADHIKPKPIPYCGDMSSQATIIQGHQNGFTMCFDSLRESSSIGFNADKWDVVVIDETDQGFRHLLQSTTKVAQHRAEILENFATLVNCVLQKPHGKIYLSSADLTPTEVNMVCQLSSRSETLSYSEDEELEERFRSPSVQIIHNTFKPVKEQKRKAFVSNKIAPVISVLIKQLRNLTPGNKILICTDSQKPSGKISSHSLSSLIGLCDELDYQNKLGLNEFTVVDGEIVYKENNPRLQKERKKLKVLRIDATTIVDLQQQYGSIQGIINAIPFFDIIILSPVGETGLSIGDWTSTLFQSVFVFAGGTLTAQSVCQIAERYRGSCPRYFYVRKTGFFIGAGDTSVGSFMNIVSKKRKNSVLVDTLTQLKVIDSDVNFVYNNENARIFELTYSIYAATHNYSAWHHYDNVVRILTQDGYCVMDFSDLIDEFEAKTVIQINSAINYTIHRKEVTSTSLITDQELSDLEQKDEKTERENIEQKKNIIARSYNMITQEDKVCVDSSDNPEDFNSLKEAMAVPSDIFCNLIAIADKSPRLMRKFSLLASLINGENITRMQDSQFIASLKENEKVLFSFDFILKPRELKTRILEYLGITNMVLQWWAAIITTGDNKNEETYKEAQNKWEEANPTVTMSSPEIVAIADKAKKIKCHLKNHFGIKIATEGNKASPIFIVNQLLALVGLKMTCVARLGPRLKRSYHYSTFLAFDVPSKVFEMSLSSIEKQTELIPPPPKTNKAINYLIHTVACIVESQFERVEKKSLQVAY